MDMNGSEEEKQKTRTTNTTKLSKLSFSLLTSALLILSSIAAAQQLIIMPQIMIVSVNAQSEEASEHACPVPGYTLSRGECTAEPIIKFECKPSSLGGVTAVLTNDQCTVRAGISDIQENECNELGGVFSTFEHKKPPTSECIFPATETPSCPGDVVPTEQGECITRPGLGNDPRT